MAEHTVETANKPDFSGLVRFLVEPFLESPNALKIDCESIPQRSKVWIRVAFDGGDRGRVFGRGGRNIQAICKVLKATAEMVGWSAYLDVYGESAHESPSNRGDRRRHSGHRPPKLR